MPGDEKNDRNHHRDSGTVDVKMSELENDIKSNLSTKLGNQEDVYTITGSTVPLHGSEIPPEHLQDSAMRRFSYNPYNYRELNAPTTNTETLVHLLKGSLGTGILAMPNAFFHAGLALGTVGTLLIGSLAIYCLHVLARHLSRSLLELQHFLQLISWEYIGKEVIRSQFQLCKRLRIPALTYPKTLEVSLESGPSFLRRGSRFAGIVVDVFLITYQLGICCVYVVFVASNIKQVVDEYWESIDVRIYMVILLPPLILLNYVRNLKLLAPFSVVANIITFIALGITLYYIFDGIPSPGDRNMVGELKNFPLFVGTTLFALEAVGVIITLENNMKNPGDFLGYTGVLNKGMSVILFLYVFLGFTGYTKYGEHAEGSITLNLPNGDKLAQSVKIMIAFAIFVTYGLQCYVPVEIVWYGYLKERLEKSSKMKQIFVEYLMRTAMVLATFLLAVAIPRLELFISLFGALCLSMLGMTFPALVELCLLWPDKYGKFKLILVKDVCIIILGIAALVIGTYTSVHEIVESFL